MILNRGFPAPGDLSSFLRSSPAGPGDTLGTGAGEVLEVAGDGLSRTGWRVAVIRFYLFEYSFAILFKPNN